MVANERKKDWITVMINSNQEPTMQMGLPPDFMEVNRERIDRHIKTQRYKYMGIGAAYVVGFMGVIALGVESIGSEEASSSQAIPEIETIVSAASTTTTEQASTTTVEATTTTSTTVQRLCVTPTMEIQSGESLFGIATLCNVALVDLIVYNPEIVNPDNVAAGTVVRTAPPETTTTLPAETVPPTAPETIPTETLAPEPVVETTAVIQPSPLDTTPALPVNDGVLTKEACIALGGEKYSFPSGKGLMWLLKTRFGFNDSQALKASRSQRIIDLRLVQVYADDLNDTVDLSECVPKTTEGLL